jgi:hypothetical protein
MQPKEKIRTSIDDMKLGIMKKVFIYSKVRIDLYRYLKRNASVGEVGEIPEICCKILEKLPKSPDSK